jgi:hypothetical protein
LFFNYSKNEKLLSLKNGAKDKKNIDKTVPASLRREKKLCLRVFVLFKQ